MNIKTANRLCELRKKNGLSQEDLADKLGVSRQAVSKWERSESSPDTDNLIELAKLYGISLDELINGDEDVEDIIKENKEADKEAKEKIVYDEIDSNEEGIEIKNHRINIQDDEGQRVSIGRDGVVIVDKDGEKKYSKEELKERAKSHRVSGIISGIYVFAATIAFILLGSFNILGGYGTWWVLFVGIPVVASFCDAVIEKKPTTFAYPVLAALLYLIGGTFFGIWHPTWVIFVTIPIYYIITSAIEKNKKGTNKKED